MRVDAIELKILVEGVRLPGRAWGSFECTVTRGGGATGSLVVPAIPGLRQEDWARARVHVFWSDIDIRSQTDDWPILFEGEISGSNFNKSPGSRHVAFHLVGPEVYWDQCLLYFYSLDKSADGQGGSNTVLHAQRKALFFGNTVVETGTGAVGLNVVSRVLAKMRENGTDRPLPSMVRRIFKDSLVSTNYFFQRANSELKLDQRFAVPRDDNIALLYGSSELWFQAMESDIAAREGPTPIGDVLRDALAYLRYNLTINSQPRFTTGGEQYRLRAEQERTRITADINVKVFDRLGVSVADLGVTGATGDAELESMAADNTNSLQSIANDPRRMHTLTDDEIVLLGDPLTNTSDNIAVRNQARVTETLDFLKTIRDELFRISQPATEVDKNPLYPADEDQPADQLAQYLLLPETDFALPPTCNVIFPSESSSYAMSRNHLTEPTRLQVSTPVVTQDVQNIYFAPEAIASARVPARTVTPVNVNGTFPPVIGAKKSGFGRRDAPTARADGLKRENHRGLDIAVPKNTEVRAFDDGVVIYSGWEHKEDHERGAGFYVAIRHAGGVITQYFHLTPTDVVRRGQQVSAGDLIGYSGNTGRSSGPHLHFEYVENGVKMDPEPHYDAALARYDNAQTPVDVDGDVDMSVEVAEVVLRDDAKQSSRFDDFKYLTPEEEVLGIVADFETSVSTAMASFERSNPTEVTEYWRQYAHATFERRRYAARNVGQLPLTFAPNLVCGLPVLVVDPVRSYLAQVESITHRVSVMGAPDASTTLSVSQPRFWDEGDPYYWRGGEAKFVSGEKITLLPDAKVARFPAFHLPSLVATNSHTSNPVSESSERFGGDKKNRPIDELYQGLIGVSAIPYFYVEDESPVTGAVRAYNQAIDGFTDSVRSPRTLVGYYENLRSQSVDLAQQFAKNYTRRLGASESQVLVDFMRATRVGGDYQGGPFRARVQAVVKDYVVKLLTQDAFRG